MPQLYEYDDIEDNFKLVLDFIELNLNFFNLQDYLNKNDISEFAKNIIITSLFIF